MADHAIPEVRKSRALFMKISMSGHKEENPLVEVRDLTVEGSGEVDDRSIRLHRVSLAIKAGEIVVFGGEAGSGKSLLCEYLSGSVRRNRKVVSGYVRIAGLDAIRKRGAPLISLVYYLGRDPAAAFNPHHTVEHSLREFTALLAKVSKSRRKVDWNEAFYAVGIVEPERVLRRVITELPLMLLQRLALMRALLSKAQVIVCDEATAGLDRIAESQFIDLVTQIRDEANVTFILGMGRLRNVERFADRIFVFFEGGILESGFPGALVTNPSCRYTAEFIAIAPRLTHLARPLPLISPEAIAEAEAIIHGQERILFPEEE